jgi:diguanylate cyclase (GGDEF)-like protein/PAS domain S-box-containing protein
MQAAAGIVADGELFHALFEASPDGLLLVDEQGLIVHANAPAHRMFRVSPGGLAGRPVEMLVPPARRSEHARQRQGYAAAPAARGMGVGKDLWAMRADGAEFPADISLSPIDWRGRRLVMAAVRDITERHRSEQLLRDALQEQALRDPLTRLFNRRMLDEALQLDFARARRKSASVAIIMADIDHFKQVNDSFGHDCGDYVLQRLAGALQGQMRSGDLVCRYGGEEFTLILPGCSVAAACERAEQIRAILRRMDWATAACQIPAITLSFGVATFPLHGATPERVLKAADTAMLSAKVAGRDRVVVASAPHPEGAPGLDRHALQAQL